MSLSPRKIPKLLGLARGRDCVKCRAGADTVVAAHYQGIRSHAYGKGRGLKPHDALAAHLCHCCHQRADTSGLAPTPEAHSARFQLLVIVTQLELWLEGRTTATGAGLALLEELAGNGAALLEAAEDDLHRHLLDIAGAWDAGAIEVAAGGAMVGDYVPDVPGVAHA